LNQKKNGPAIEAVLARDALRVLRELRGRFLGMRTLRAVRALASV